MPPAGWQAAFFCRRLVFAGLELPVPGRPVLQLRLFWGTGEPLLAFSVELLFSPVAPLLLQA